MPLLLESLILLLVTLAAYLAIGMFQDLSIVAMVNMLV